MKGIMKSLKGLSIAALSILITAGIADAHAEGMGPGQHFNHQGIEMEHNTVMPHLVLGGGYETEVVLMNPGMGQQVDGTLHFYAQDGSPLQIPHNGRMQSVIDVTLPEGGFMSLILGSPEDPKKVGWAMFVNDDSQPDPEDFGLYMGDHLFAGVFYRLHNSNTQQLSTQVGMMGTRFVSGWGMGHGMMVRNDDQNTTGFAMVNTSDVEMPATFTLTHPDGSMFAQQEVTLQPGHQMVSLLSDFFEGENNFSHFEGTLEIRTDQEGMVPMGLIITDGILTSTPMVNIPDAQPHEHGQGATGGPGGGMMH